jgi:hypothetical protein
MAGVAGPQEARVKPARTVIKSKRIENSFFDMVSSLWLKIIGFYIILSQNAITQKGSIRSSIHISFNSIYTIA